MKPGKKARKFLSILLMAALGMTAATEAFAAPAGPDVSENSEDEEAYDPLNTMLMLNLAVVSVNNVITTQDRIVLDQEYNNIINNRRFGNVAYDSKLKKLYDRLLDTLARRKLNMEEAQRFQAVYDRSQKRALTSTIVHTRMPIGGNAWSFIGSLLATGVQAYFGYQDQKEQLRVELDNSLWQLKKEEVFQFNELQKDLLDASWHLLDEYRRQLHDEYLIRQEDLSMLFRAQNASTPAQAVRMFERLRSSFSAYPPFWYFYGEAAYKDGDTEKALQCFDQFDKVWRPVLRRDPYRLQVAKERICLEQNIQPERIKDLLAIVKENTAPADWMDSLFYGAVAFAVGMKREGMNAVQGNIDFDVEKDISPVLLSSMETGKMNLAGLSQEIQDAVAAGEKSVAAVAKNKTSAADIDGDTAEALQLWFNGDDEASAKLCQKLIEGNTDDPLPYYLYYRLLSDGVETAKGYVKAQQCINKLDEMTKTNTENHQALAPLCREEAEKGNARAQFLWGEMLYHGLGVDQDKKGAAEWYRKSAEQGLAVAQCTLGWMYANGYGVEKDPAEAVKWLRKAAEQGNAAAQFNLGLMYWNGEGVSRDSAEAVRWYRKAAEQGLAAAQNHLGRMYAIDAIGKGVAKDSVEAVHWFRKAAEQGEATAQSNLGYCYYLGIGVPRDYEEAYVWYYLARMNGYENAQKKLDDLEEKGGFFSSAKLSPEAIFRARARAQQIYDKQHEK